MVKSPTPVAFVTQLGTLTLNTFAKSLYNLITVLNASLAAVFAIAPNVGPTPLTHDKKPLHPLFPLSFQSFHNPATKFPMNMNGNAITPKIACDANIKTPITILIIERTKATKYAQPVTSFSMPLSTPFIIQSPNLPKSFINSSLYL